MRSRRLDHAIYIPTPRGVVAAARGGGRGARGRVGGAAVTHFHARRAGRL